MPAGNVSGEKLIISYLAAVATAAARYLPKGDRMRFVGHLRALIERRCGPIDHAQPGLVAAVLAELGEPQDVVMQERERLDSARARRRASGQGPAAAPPAPWEQRPLTSRWRPATGDRPRLRPSGGLKGGKRLPPRSPGETRPAAGGGSAAPWAASGKRPARWPGSRTGDQKPAQPGAADGQAPVTDGPGTGGTATPAAPDQVFSERALRDSRGPRASAPGPADPDIEPGLAGPDLAFGPAGPDLGPGPVGEDPGGRGRREPGPAGPVPEGLDPAAVGLDGPDPAGAIPPVSLYPAGREPAAIEPTSLVPPARPGLPDESPGPAASGPSTIPGFTLPQHPAGEARPGSDLPPASGQPGAPVPLTLAGLAALMRSHIRETVAVILLGIGGLVLPFPFWLLGAGAAALSRFWEVRIKWLALIGPPLFVLVVSVPIAAISRGHGNLAAIYAHVLRLDLGYLIRIGCVVTAAYLGWLVRRGPRARVPPWRR